MNDMNLLQQKDIDYLKERIAKLEHTTEAGFIELKTKIDLLMEGYVRKAELDKELKTRDEDIKELQDNLRWMARTVFGAVVTGILAFIGLK